MAPDSASLGKFSIGKEGFGPSKSAPRWMMMGASVQCTSIGSRKIAWMVLRTLPFLQSDELRFSSKWAEQWWVLDDSFRQTVESLGDLGKKIASAFIAMMDAKFGSSQDVRYTEPGLSVEAAPNGG
jgi:hypothetical protein